MSPDTSNDPSSDITRATPLPTFDPVSPLPSGRVSLQASAGTGKTWAIAALVTRYVAEGRATLDELLVVTFTRAATAELRHRIRQRLTEAARHLRAVLATRATVTTPAAGPAAGTAGTPASGHGPDDADDDPILTHLGAPTVATGELQLRLARLQHALAGIDRGLIATIHGFAHQVLRSAGHIGDIDGQLTLVEDVDDLITAAGRDLLVRLYASEPDDDVLAARPTERKVTALTVQRLRHPHAAVSPHVDDPDVEEQARQLARMADLVGGEIRTGKQRRGTMTFDDLLHQLAEALHDPLVRTTILATFRQRFRIALVDEAQDTDPVQWDILEALFEDRTLVVIGDPKQAIYRFRGADVHAYVRAVNTRDTQQYGLTTNHRSDRVLVEAVNALFRDTTFGHRAITHTAVDARHARRLHDPTGDAPLHLRIVPKREDKLYAGATRRRIATDLAGRITRLLTNGATIPGNDGPRAVTPGDLAILVRAHASVADVTAALATVNVPYVVTGVGSVFETSAAHQWRTLLAGLGRPSSTTGLRALASSDFVGWDAPRLARADDGDLDALATMVHRWAHLLRDDGVASLLRTIHGDTGMGPRLLGRADGKRLLTDIEHIGELLHGSEASGQGPGAMVEWLDQQAQRVSVDDIPAEERTRRLESDSDAVTIMTVHAAKGLEFPIVYLPYMMWQLRKPSIPFTTTGDDPVLELGGPDSDDHREAGKLADAGEYLRLAYVAMTRARHRVEAWWWQSGGYTDMPLSKLLLRGSSPGPVAAQTRSGRASGMAAALDDLGRATGGAVTWAEVPEEPVATATWTGPDHTVEQVSAAIFDRPIDRTWTRTSYTRLTTPLAHLSDAPHGHSAVGHGRNREGDHEPGNDQATTLRTDEHDQASQAGRDAIRDSRDRTPAVALPLGPMTGGARVGTLVHDLYEHVDFAATDVERQLHDRLGMLVGKDAEGVFGIPATDVVAGIIATLDTPLGPGFGNLALRQVPRAERLDEMAFEMPVATTSDRPLRDVDDRRPDGVDIAGIRDVFTTLPGDDPMVAYVDRLDDPALARTVRGYLTGFVDLVLRRQVDGASVFHVIDYKTNVTYRRDEHPTTDHYRHDALVEAMHYGHYPLQAALYAVALHRYLRWRLGDYDPARNLGAIGYLFVRGMVGPTTPVGPATSSSAAAGQPAGVMAWHPPVEFVTTLSDRLHTGTTT